MLVQPRRDKRAALRLLRTLLKKLGFAPKLLVTDKLRSYGSEFRHLRLTCPHEQGLRSKIERRTLIRWCDDESERCNGSNQHNPPNAFSASMPRSTIISIFKHHLVSRAPPGRRSHSGAQNTGIRGLLPAGRPGPTSYNAGRPITALKGTGIRTLGHSGRPRARRGFDVPAARGGGSHGRNYRARRLRTAPRPA